MSERTEMFVKRRAGWRGSGVSNRIIIILLLGSSVDIYIYIYSQISFCTIYKIQIVYKIFM